MARMDAAHGKADPRSRADTCRDDVGAIPVSGERMPNARRASVPRRKIVGYLLAANHPIGRSKARFFAAFGFSAARWESLAGALRRHALENPVVAREETPFGTRFVIEGILHAPDGRTPAVCVVWLIPQGRYVPRLVTAYPAKGRRRDPRA